MKGVESAREKRDRELSHYDCPLLVTSKKRSSGALRTKNLLLEIHPSDMFEYG